MPLRILIEKSAAWSAACPRSLTSPLAFSSAKATPGTSRFVSKRCSGTNPLRKIFHENGTRSGLTAACSQMVVVQLSVAELYQAGREKAEEIGQKARSAAARTANPFTAAVDAGKDAYIAEKRRTESKAISEGRPSYPVGDDGEKN